MLRYSVSPLQGLVLVIVITQGGAGRLAPPCSALADLLWPLWGGSLPEDSLERGSFVTLMNRGGSFGANGGLAIWINIAAAVLREACGTGFPAGQAYRLLEETDWKVGPTLELG